MGRKEQHHLSAVIHVSGRPGNQIQSFIRMFPFFNLHWTNEAKSMCSHLKGAATVASFPVPFGGSDYNVSRVDPVHIFILVVSNMLQQKVVQENAAGPSYCGEGRDNNSTSCFVVNCPF